MCAVYACCASATPLVRKDHHAAPGSFIYATLLQEDCSSRTIYANIHLSEWCVRWPLHDCRTLGGIKDSAMTGALQISTGLIIVHRAASVCAGRVIGYKLIIGEVNQHTRITC